MIDLLKNFYSLPVVIFIVGIVILPSLVSLSTSLWKKRITSRRKKEGLGGKVLRNPEVTLRVERKQTVVETLLFIVLACGLPLVLIKLVEIAPVLVPEGSCPDAEIEKINLAFAAFLLWVLLSGTTVAKNFLGGMAFKAVNAFAGGVQVGDRATLGGHHGIIQEIGTFYTQLQTLDDDLVSVPTAGLLDSVLSSTNGGGRPSLCVIPFFLDPFTNPKESQKAEDIIWETIQSSSFYDFGHPIKIFYSQSEAALTLKAKAYVASTYDEAEFKSEITKKVLRAFDKEGIKVCSLGFLRQR